MKGAFQTFLSYLLCDWLATVGAIIVTTSAVVFVTLAFQSFSNPYYGLIVFIVFPAFFFAGLLAIPLGVWRCSRRLGGVQNIPQPTGTAAMRFLGLIAILTIL